MKWKLIDKVTGKSTYFDPETTQFQLENCKLVNCRKTAAKIHAGSHKQVCAFVTFSNYSEIPKTSVTRPVMYNPRIAPHWRNAQGEDLDGHIFKSLRTLGNKIFVQA